MNRCIFVFAIASIGAVSLQAQDFESLKPDLGFKVGIPVADRFNTGTGFSSHTPRYTFGVTGEFRLPKNLRFEIDGLYKRGGFNSALPWPGGGLAYRPTTFNWWEIPGLLKYNVNNFSVANLHPFVDFGASLRHISTISQTTQAAGLFNGFTTTDNSIALHNRNSFGGVAGIGVTFKVGSVKLSPEARYTRWANEAFQTNGLRTNLDQGDILLGITF